MFVLSIAPEQHFCAHYPAKAGIKSSMTKRSVSNMRLEEARLNAGFKKMADAVRRFDWHPQTYASHENGQTRRIPDQAAMAYGKAYNVNPAWLKNLSDIRVLPNESTVAPDGEKINVDELEPHQARALGAVMAGMKAEAWQITSDMMTGLTFMPGDVVNVDLAARPKPRDVVLAESSRIPIFRQYVPTGLWSFHMSGQNPTIPMERAQIKGVVVFKLSI